MPESALESGCIDFVRSPEDIAALLRSAREHQTIVVLWITELAERTLESPHDHARINARLARVRDALEAEPAARKTEYESGERASSS